MKNISEDLRLDAIHQKQQRYHFSVDDVFDSLIEVTDSGMPLKEHPFFAILWEMWQKYDLKTGLHLFYQKELNGRLRTLKEVRNICEELKSGWILFGPHALDPLTPPYSQSVEQQKFVFDNTYHQIKRFAGNYSTNYVRLHHYSESYELSEYFKEKGVRALFSTDRSIGSHRMPDRNRVDLIEKGYTDYNNFPFVRTDFRVENFANQSLEFDGIHSMFEEAIERYSRIIIYAHEYEFQRVEVCNILKVCVDILANSLKLKNVSP